MAVLAEQTHARDEIALSVPLLRRIIHQRVMIRDPVRQIPDGVQFDSNYRNMVTPDLTEDEILEGKVRIVGRFDPPGGSFDQELPNLVEEVKDWEKMVSSVRPSRVTESALKAISHESQHQGMCVHRTAMILHGHRYHISRYGWEIDSIGTYYLDTSNGVVGEQIESSPQTLCWHSSFSREPVNYYHNNELLHRMKDVSKLLGITLSSYIRQCLSIAALSTNTKDVSDGIYREWDGRFEKWVEYQLDQKVPWYNSRRL